MPTKWSVQCFRTLCMISYIFVLSVGLEIINHSIPTVTQCKNLEFYKIHSRHSIAIYEKYKFQFDKVIQRYYLSEVASVYI